MGRRRHSNVCNVFLQLLSKVQSKIDDRNEFEDIVKVSLDMLVYWKAILNYIYYLF